MLTRENPDTCAVLLLVVLGMSVCFAIVFVDPKGTADVIRTNPYFLIWLFLVAVQGALMALLPVPLLREISPLRDHLRIRRVRISVFTLTFLLLSIVPAVSIAQLLNVNYPLPFHESKFRCLTALALLLTALPAAIGVYSVQLTASDRLQKKLVDPRGFLELRRKLMFFLLVLGLMVALGTLIVGASRKALVANDPDNLPAELLLAYGGYFTMLVAAIYAPAHVAMREVARRVLVESMGLDTETEPLDWQETAKKRSTIEAQLGVGVSLMQRLQEAIPIAAPLLSGLFTFVLR